MIQFDDPTELEQYEEPTETETNTATSAPMTGNQPTANATTQTQTNGNAPQKQQTNEPPKTELQKLLEAKPQTIEAIVNLSRKCAAMGLEYERALRARGGEGIDLGLRFFRPYGKIHRYDKLLFDGATVIGARTAGGKTLSMINLAAEALKRGHKVLFLSLEEKSPKVFDNILLAYSELTRNDKTECSTKENKARILDRLKLKNIFDSNPHKNDFVANDKTETCKRNLRFLRQNCFVVGDEVDCITQILKVSELIKQYIAFCRKESPDGNAEIIIFLDYLQKLRGDQHKEGYAQVQECTDTLTKLKNEDRVHLIAGVQLNRDVPKSISRMADARTKAKQEFQAVQKEDIREAADIEHFAELILFTQQYTDNDGNKEQHYKVLKHRGDLTDYTMECSFEQSAHFLNFENPSESWLGLRDGETAANLKNSMPVNSEDEETTETAPPAETDNTADKGESTTAATQTGLFGQGYTVGKIGKNKEEK